MAEQQACTNAPFPARTGVANPAATAPRPDGAATFKSLQDSAMAERLAVMGAFHPLASDECPPGTATMVLFGPAEPGFWPHVTAQPEFADGGPDPLDRWSRRAISALARQHGGQAVFPFTGPPYHPFVAWALRSRRAWVSPVQLLVHERAGLFASYRGAVALADQLELPPPPQRSPCETCAAQPCRSACPANALHEGGYDVPACHAWLDTEAGHDCLQRGCAVRRACPLSGGRQEAQSAYHMSHFHRE